MLRVRIGAEVDSKVAMHFGLRYSTRPPQLRQEQRDDFRVVRFLYVPQM